ncbi:MAG: adenylate/guanylate cyclase domain-containing protein [Anderseniella sp.]|jgi:adenylate cyclase|nr:adenylate/guanylate cyclase domain-containing protein [Anderseniella sp.]
MDHWSSDFLAAPGWLATRVSNPALCHLLILVISLPVLAGSIWLMNQYLIAEGAITLAAFPISLSLVGGFYLGPAVPLALVIVLFASFTWIFGLTAFPAAAYAVMYGAVVAMAAVGLRVSKFRDFETRPVRSVLVWYIIAGVIAPVMTTVLGVPLLAWGGGVEAGANYPILMVSNYISDSFSPVSLGLALCAVIERSFAHSVGAEEQPSFQVGYEKLAWLVVAAAIILSVTPFGERWSTHGIVAVTPAVYLLLAWSALRFSMAFTMAVTALAGLYITSCMAFGLGGTVVPKSTADFLLIYADLLAMTVLAQLTSAMTRQRKLDNRRALAAELDRARLKRYFSPHIVDQLLASSDAIDKTHSQKAVVMFADIVGFTSISERQTPEQTIAMLREFDTAMEAEIFDNSGVVDKYLGDGVMAAFGLPRPGEKQVTSALRCALGMIQRVAELAETRRKAGYQPYALGIGLHYGDVVAGHVGSERNLSFTVIGDTVNTASRLESLTRELGASIVISDAVVEALKKEAGQAYLEDLRGFERVGKKAVKGRTGAVGVWMLPR